MKKGFFHRFIEWQNYVHYLLLTLVMSIIAFKFGARLDLRMFAILYLTIFVADTIIHGIFWFLPKPVRWRD